MKIQVIAFFWIILASWPACAADSPLVRKYPPPRDIADLSIPTGHLEEAAISNNLATFIDIDHIENKDSQIIFSIFEVWDPARPFGNFFITQSVTRVVFDCKENRFRELGSMEYESDGSLVIWLDKDAQYKQFGHSNLFDTLKIKQCSTLSQVHLGVFVGHQAAFNEGIRLMRAIRSEQPDH